MYSTGLDWYCDSDCHSLSTYLHLNRLYDNQGTCQAACDGSFVNYTDTNSHYYCDVTCYNLAQNSALQASSFHLFNKLGTCDTSSATNVYTVSLTTGSEKYTSENCYAIAMFLNLTILFNNEATCQTSCGSNKVKFVSGDETYCD